MRQPSSTETIDVAYHGAQHLNAMPQKATQSGATESASPELLCRGNSPQSPARPNPETPTGRECGKAQGDGCPGVPAWRVSVPHDDSGEHGLRRTEAKGKDHASGVIFREVRLQYEIPSCVQNPSTICGLKIILWMLAGSCIQCAVY